jgi:hypothetical protein
MGTILFVFILLALAQLLYEYIVLPAVRLRLKFKLFALRDELRRYEIENRGNSEMDTVLIDYVYENINITMISLNSISTRTMLAAKRLLETDKALREEVMERMRVFEKLAPQPLKEIQKEKIDIVKRSVIFNSVWQVSLFYFLYFLHKAEERKFVRKFVSIPEKKINKIIKSPKLSFAGA